MAAYTTTNHDFFPRRIAVSLATAIVFLAWGPLAPARGQCTAQQLAELIGTDTAPSDSFGQSVAVSGDTAVVGAASHQTAGLVGAGSAYVFVRTGGNWSQQYELIANDPMAGDQFGVSVAVSGDTAVVGSPVRGNHTGQAYVFVRTGTTWTQQQVLTASDPAANAYFGDRVAVSGNTVVVGAPVRGNYAGAAYVFVRTGRTWTQQQKLPPPEPLVKIFGGSVAVSGETALIGASNNSGVGGNGIGAAYVFVRSSGAWTQQSKLTNSNPATNDGFGGSTALSGDTAVVGAGNPGIGSAASAYVFVKPGGGWTNMTQTARLTAFQPGTDGDSFGASVAVSGDIAVVGASNNDNAGGPNAGAAYVFVKPGAGWTSMTETAKLTASNGTNNSAFGYSVGVSGNTAMVGRAAAPNGGTAYVFFPGCPDCNTDGIPDGLQLTGAINSRWAAIEFPYIWNRAANWCLPLVPNNGTPATNTYSVNIPGSTPICTLDISPVITSLTIGLGGTLEVNSGSLAPVRTLVVLPPNPNDPPTIQNSGTIRAKDAERLLLDAADINQAPTGVIEAVGAPGQASKIQINGHSVIGGTARTNGDSAVIELLGGAVLKGVTVEGNVVSLSSPTVSVPTGQTGRVSQPIANNGLITVAQPDSTVATFLSPLDDGVAFSGSGCVQMQNRFARLGEFKGFIINDSGHCVEGAGRVFGGFTNGVGGAVTANHPNHKLTISAPGTKISDGLMQAVDSGTLSIEDNVFGTGQLVAEGGEINVPGLAPVTVGCSTVDVGNGGTVSLNGSSNIAATGHVHLVCGGGLLLGCIRPLLSVAGNASMSVGGNLQSEGAMSVSGGTSFTLAGNFDNHSNDATDFHWDTGPLTMNGSSPQSFELAGLDFGPVDPAGFVDNFAMGTLRIEPGRTVDFFNNFDNLPGSGCEVLYVHTLSLGAGSTIILHGCNIYYDTLEQDSGTTVLNTNGSLLLSIHAGDLNYDGNVDINDVDQFISLLLGNLCSVQCIARSDMNGDGFVNGADISLMVRLLTGW